MKALSGWMLGSRPAVKRFVMRLAAAVGFVGLAMLPSQVTRAAPASPLALPQVHLVVAFTPGGAVDSVTRYLADALQKGTGATVIVENKPGAGGNIAANYVAHAATRRDVVNVLMTSTNHYVNPVLMRQTGYDPYKDFVPINYASQIPYVFVVPANSGDRKMSDLVARGRAKPGTVSYAFGGIGTVAQFLGLALEQTQHFEGNPVVYKGGSEMVTALVGGQIDLAIITVQSAAPLVRDGKLRALAITGDVPNKALPDVPSVTRTLPGFPVINGYVALMVGKDTPADLQATLQRAFNEVIVSQGYRQRLDVDGSTARTFDSIAQSRAFFDALGLRLEAIARDSKIRLD